MTDGSRKAVLAAMAANAGIAIAKFVGFLLTASASLLAEAVHSLADTGNQALLLLGGKRARKAATEQHPFGYGRERYFWAFAVALVLFSLGGMFALYEGIQKFRDPHEIESLPIAIGILVFAILLESYSLRTAVKEARHVKPQSVSWWKFIRTTKQPELPVVLLEDVGAEVGLFLALGGVMMAQFTEDPRWDAVGSISIGILLIVIAVFLIIEMKGLLIGEAAGEKDRTAIIGAIESSANVDRLIHMRTEHIGPDEVLVGAKIEYSSSLDADQLVAAINATEDAIRAAAPTVTVIYLEPDILRADHPDLHADLTDDSDRSH
ncbi:cation diffusion facilitator family transporter [Ilumatobacter sp.]|uniref:cation diffusion facilitator family transporter n=1 Tax=Ilumatobacter sp. TaxID=1967498 RepID=UPI003C3E1F39